jgi:hypothetical protein
MKPPWCTPSQGRLSRSTKSMGGGDTMHGVTTTTNYLSLNEWMLIYMVSLGF